MSSLPSARTWLLTAAGTSLDRLVWIILAVCAVTILGLHLAGDHVGVRVVRSGPGGEARRSSAITLGFSEPMDRESVAQRLRVEPPVAGELGWSGSTLLLRPTTDLHEGETYAVLLEAGARSEAGRELLSDYRFSFRVVGSRVAYLAPADSEVKNLWMRELGTDGEARALTDSKTGIVTFDVSPDGSRIAYAERKGQTASTELRLLNLDTRQVTTLTDCGTNVCTTPAWKPDGSQIAYEQFAYSAVEPGVQTSSSRVWILAPGAPPDQARPLFADPLTPPNYKPRWAPDGSRIAVSQLVFFPTRNPGILVYTFTTAKTEFFPTSFGTTGSFSPDGNSFAFPGFTIRGGEVRNILQVADLRSGEQAELTEPGGPQEEGAPEWRPGRNEVTVARRIVDGQPVASRQLYALTTDQHESRPLLVDASYDHDFFAWDPDGRRLVVQRAPISDSGPRARAAQPEIWVLDTLGGSLGRIATNAFAPRWVH